MVPFALDPDRKTPAPEALQTVAGGKRRAATTGGEARRAATGRKDETHTAPAGRKEGMAGSRGYDRRQKTLTRRRTRRDVSSLSTFFRPCRGGMLGTLRFRWPRIAPGHVPWPRAAFHRVE